MINEQGIDEDDLTSYYASQEFKDGIRKRIEEETWGRGIPMIYMNDAGVIVKHWKDGRIEEIQK